MHPMTHLSLRTNQMLAMSRHVPTAQTLVTVMVSKKGTTILFQDLATGNNLKSEVSPIPLDPAAAILHSVRRTLELGPELTETELNRTLDWMESLLPQMTPGSREWILTRTPVLMERWMNPRQMVTPT